VAPATLAVDLPRRDVTVNALAIALSPEDLGELRAARNALEDLAARRLRVFHAKSFVDDPTRLLRLARYAGRLGFTIEETTEQLARSAVASDALATVSGTRVGSELLAIAGERDPSASLLVARDLGLLENLHAGLRVDAAAIARGRELARVAGDADPAIVVLALVGGGLERSELRWWLDHVGLPATAREATVAGASRAAELGQALAAARRPSEIAAAVKDERPESVATAGALDERATDSARRWLSELRGIGLEINGDDLVAEGVPRGPRVAVGLDAALAARLDGIVRDRGGELRTALSAANAES
jgi:tRNA nucleotidyltransferase (CCA-adding enzyme)